MRHSRLVRTSVHSINLWYIRSKGNMEGKLRRLMKLWVISKIFYTLARTYKARTQILTTMEFQPLGIVIETLQVRVRAPFPYALHFDTLISNHDTAVTVKTVAWQASNTLVSRLFCSQSVFPCCTPRLWTSCVFQFQRSSACFMVDNRLPGRRTLTTRVMVNHNFQSRTRKYAKCTCSGDV